MKILLAGPTETASLVSALGDVRGLPPATVATPVNVLAIEYIRQGHEVTLVTLDKSVCECVSVSRNRLTVVFVPERRRARYLALTMFEREIRRMVEVIREAKPDFVHAHWTYEFAEAGVRSGFPLLVTGHDSAWRTVRLFANAYRAIRLLMTFRTLPRVRDLTVVSPYLLRHMRMQAFFGPIKVVPNGLDLVEWPYVTKSPPRGQVVIVAVGNGDYQKNMAAAVAAFIQIRQSLPLAQLHLFGPTLEQFAEIEGITVHGAVANHVLRQFLCEKAHLFIHPSLQECCPVSIIEAKAIGIPVVAGERSGGVPYVMGNANPGLVNVRNPEEIARKAIEMLSDTRLYKSLSSEGRADVERRFDIRTIAAQYFQIYEAVAKRAAPTGCNILGKSPE